MLDPWLAYVKWYTGTELEIELLCRPCADARRDGTAVAVSAVCESCFRNAAEEVGDLAGIGGQPGIHTRAEPFDTTLAHTALPAAIGLVADFAPIEASRSIWLLLAEDGTLISLNADTHEWTRRGKTTVPAEPDRETWCGHALRRRLHASSRGEFAAVVNDFGRWGEVIDLRSGRTTLSLDGGDYHAETVPFSFAFAELRGRTLAIHRTAWNRLDISDPATGELLTDRGPTSYSQNERRPQHYLDYFHGALHVSPGSTRILDDGWVWHPVGIPSTWRLEDWLENVWESEDGPSRLDFCARNYYWNGRSPGWTTRVLPSAASVTTTMKWPPAPGYSMLPRAEWRRHLGARIGSALARSMPLADQTARSSAMGSGSSHPTRPASRGGIPSQERGRDTRPDSGPPAIIAAHASSSNCERGYSCECRSE